MLSKVDRLMQQGSKKRLNLFSDAFHYYPEVYESIIRVNTTGSIQEGIK